MLFSDNINYKPLKAGNKHIFRQKVLEQKDA